MNVNFITSKIDALSKEFQTTLRVNLWENVPHYQVDNIKVPVATREAFVDRLISLTAIFDSFNKKEFDKKTEIKTRGTRESFITLLKKEFQNNHFAIQNDIETPIGMICLLRDYIAHGKNKNYQKAFDYFGEKHPVEEYGTIWSKVISKFGEVLDSTLLLLNEKDKTLIKSEEINEDLFEILKKEILHEVNSSIEDDKQKAMLREISCRDEIIDVELAHIFNIEVGELRFFLFPFTHNILIVKPNDDNSTILQVVEFMKESVKLI